ncbi:hypothetical protein JCM10213_007247 [Rhodosporidiobolus nylandii]
MGDGGSSTDYDSLPSPPLARSLSTRGRPGRQYGKRSGATRAPRLAPKTAVATSGRARATRGSVRHASSENSSGRSSEEEPVTSVKTKGRGAAKQAEERKRATRGDKADAESHEEDEGRKAAEGQQQKRQLATANSHALPSQPSQPPFPSASGAQPASHLPQSSQISTHRATRHRSHSALPDRVTPAAVGSRRTRSTRSPFPSTTGENSDASPAMSRASKKARRSLAPPAAHQLALTPPNREDEGTVHPAVATLAQREQQQHSQEGEMTPRSRVRALGDKSNRSSLGGTGTASGTARPSFPAAGLDSPRSRLASSANSARGLRRGSLAVFHDPSSLPPASRLPPPTAAVPLTDVPPRRRPLSRASSQPAFATAASGALPLPRSPGSTALPPPRGLTASPRLPRAALASRRPSPAPSAPGGALLGVPGLPPPGMALSLSRGPPPWALAAPPTSSPFSLPDTQREMEIEAGGQGGPVFRFTTTQFADLPGELSLLNPADGRGEGKQGGAEELIGMESSFLLLDEQIQDDTVVEDATARWAADETKSSGFSLSRSAVDGSEVRAAEDETMRPSAVPVRAAEEERVEVEGSLDVDGEAEQTLPAQPAIVAVDPIPELAHEGEHAVETASLSAVVATSPRPSDPSSPAQPPSTGLPIPPASLLAPPQPTSLFSAKFMPPRRPRPAVSPALPSGPPSSEDDLAYYLRVTGTFSSEDDLSSCFASGDEGRAMSSGEEENALAENEVGRAVKASSRQREKRIAAHDEASRTKEARAAVKGLRIGEGKDGRRKGWRREILSPVKGWRPVLAVRRSMQGGGDGDAGYEAQDEGESDDELRLE